MAKFHINKHGQPAICRAENGRCPYGGETGNDNHFETEVEAQDYVNRINEEQFGILNSIDSSEKEVYDIPENTLAETTIHKDLFLNENHSLKKSGDIWVHLNSEGKVVGTMKEPIILAKDNGELIEVADGENERIKNSITKLKTLKLMSKFGLLSSTAKTSADSIDLYTPLKDSDEYKTSKTNEFKEQEKRSMEAFILRMEQRGGNKTAELFSNEDNDISAYFREKEGNIEEPQIVNYNPKLDDWDNAVPSADNFSISAYRNKNLDIQKINNHWAVTDDKGHIYGRLDEPAVAVNFETEMIESIGEASRIEKECKMAEKDERFTKDENKMLNRIGMVRLDDKSNDLNKVRDLFEYSWAFRE